MATEKIKIAFIGDRNVGKTAIIQSTAGNAFPSKYKITIAQGSVEKKTAKNNTLELWDIPGRDKPNHTMLGQFRVTDAFIFVIDGTKPLNEIDERIKAQLEAAKAKEKSPPAKFYIAINKCDLDLHDDFKDETAVKAFVMGSGIREEDLAGTFSISALKGENVNALLNKVELDYLHANPKIQESPAPLAKKTSIPKQSSLPTHSRPTHSRVWIGGNLLFAAGGAALLGLSIASIVTGGILPAVIIGLSIALGVGVVGWNIVCKIYDHYSEKEGLPPPPVNPENISKSGACSAPKGQLDPAPTNPEVNSNPLFTPDSSSGASTQTPQLDVEPQLPTNESKNPNLKND